MAAVIIRRITTCLIVVLAIIGCKSSVGGATAKPLNYPSDITDTVKKGWTREQVSSAIGPPNAKATLAIPTQDEQWFYDIPRTKPEYRIVVTYLGGLVQQTYAFPYSEVNPANRPAAPEGSR